MKVLYDSHMHLLTLGHPSFLAFLETVRHRGFEQLWSQIAAPSYLIGTLFFKGGEATRNILSVMENDVAGILELLEDDLSGAFRKPGDPAPLLRDGRISFGGQEYERLVLEPMLMDFQSSRANSPDIYYDRAPAMPISGQVDDILEGIQKYRRRRPDGFLIVRPFLGIHPQHYDAQGLRALLASAFRGFRRSSSGHKEAWHSTLRYSGNPERTPRGSFAGVKVYPPLGFDPWPEEEGEEREKLRILYGFCQENRIPMATHCDDQGYRVIPLEDSFRFTSPARWRPALEAFPGLEVCFAHFGQQYIRGPGAPPMGQWANEIVDLILERPGVWTDFSFDGAETEYYAALEERLNRMDKISRERLERAILFGTDFPMCLMKTRSYSDYWRTYLESPLTERHKSLFAEENGRAFLFGE